MAKKAQETSPKEKKAAGRPSSFRPEFIEESRKLALLGATDREIADFFGVSEQTLNTWKSQHPGFLESLKLGKEEADNRVEQSLYRRAIGYQHDAVKITVNAQGMETVTPYVERYPPDTTACIFWLKNRRKDLWRDKLDHEHTGKNGGPIETVEISENERARRIAFALEQGMRSQTEH